MNKTIYWFSLIMLTLAASLRAEAPNVLTYQGRLKEGGQAVTANRTVEILLCDDPAAGSCYTSGVQPVAVSNGLFRSTFTVPAAANFGAGNWYLEIWVAGTRLLPRERLTSSAYSLFAATAAYATNIAAATGSDGIYISSNLFVTGGNVGIGTAAPAAMLDVRDVNAVNPYVLALGTGTAAPFFLVSKSGSVEIGDGTPSTQTVLQASAVARNSTIGQEDVTLGLMANVRAEGTGIEDAAAGADFHATADGSQNIGYLVGIHTMVERPTSGSGTINKAIGLYVDETHNSSGPGGITDTYGVYIARQTEGSQINAPYALYSEDQNARVYIAGKVGISSDTPAYALTVSSAAGSSDVILAVSTGSSVVFGVKGNGEVMAGKYFGDGSALVNLPVSGGAVSKSGDVMTGQLTIDGSSLTVQGGGSVHFAVDNNGKAGIGAYADPNVGLTISGAGIYGAGIMMQNGGSDWALTNNYGVLTIVKGDGATFEAMKLYGTGSAEFPAGGLTAAGTVSAAAFIASSATLHGLAAQPYVLQAGDNGIVISTGGSVQTTGAGHGTVVGNERGMGAVDLQTARASAGQVASGPYSVIGGGQDNQAAGKISFVAGGDGNTASAQNSSVGGGSANTASANYAAVGGGSGNTASGVYGAVGGGYSNIAGGMAAAIAGGYYNTANQMEAAVAGGQYNHADGSYAAIPGGMSNSALGSYSFAAGYMSSSTANGAFTWADSQGAAVVNNVPDQVMFKAAGGFWVSTGTVYGNPGLFVAPNNSVGVGTDSPGALLHVAGSLISGQHDVVNAAGTSILRLQASGTEADIIPFGGDLRFWASGAPAVWLNGTGLGVGTAGPAYKLDVNGDMNLAAGSVYRIGGVAQSGSSKWTAGTGDNIYKSLGNVGIGLTNPTQALDVNGNVRASAVLTSQSAFTDAGLYFLNPVSSVTIQAGTSPDHTTAGGQLNIRGGNGSGSGFPIDQSPGGDVTVWGGLGSDSRGGNVRIWSGRTDAFNSAGLNSSVEIWGGQAYNQDTATGGKIVAEAPVYPDGGGSGGTYGRGGHVWIQGGNGRSGAGGTGAGGNIYLLPGTGGSGVQGNVGIGTSTPGQTLEVNGGVRVNTVTTQPACDSSSRGTFWVVQNIAGVKDDVQVCAKDAADAYAWRTIY